MQRRTNYILVITLHFVAWQNPEYSNEKKIQSTINIFDIIQLRNAEKVLMHLIYLSYFFLSDTFDSNDTFETILILGNDISQSQLQKKVGKQFGKKYVPQTTRAYVIELFMSL